MNSLPEADTRQENARQIFSATLLFFGVCIFFLWQTNIQLNESLHVSAAITIQVFTGAYIWSLVSPNKNLNLPILIGMGLAIGSFATVMSQQLLRTTALAGMAWLLPALICLTCLSHTAVLRKSVTLPKRIILPKINDICDFHLVLLGTVGLSLASRWTWLLPITVVLVFIALFQCINLITQLNRKIWVIYSFLILVSAYFSQILLNHSTSWFHFSNDQTFSESLSWSLARFGPNDSPFEVGSSIRYHWFALAWSGITTSASNASAFTLITKALPIVSFIGIIALIWGITASITQSRQSPIIAAFGFAFLWNLTELAPPLYTNSPTYLFTCVWFLASIFSVFRLLKQSSIQQFVVFILLTFATIGGKSSTGIILVAGIILGTIFCLLIPRLKIDIKKTILITAISILVLVITYVLLYLQFSGKSNNRLWIQIGASALQSGVGSSKNGALLKILSSGFLFLDLLLPSIPIFLYLVFKKSNIIELYFFLGMLITAASASFLLNAAGGSQLYFYLAAACVNPIVVAIYLEKENWHFRNSQNILIIGAGLFIAIISSYVWNLSSSKSSPTISTLLKFFAILLPWITTMILRLFFFLPGKRQLRKKHITPALASILLLLAVCSSYRLTYQYRLTVKQLVRKELGQTNLPISGSQDQAMVFDWLRANTSVLDIIATNRFCISYETNCVSKWMLMSAISQRRAYIEGGYFDWTSKNQMPTPAQQNKIDNCIQFATSPNTQNWLPLITYNVSWFIVDHAASPPLQSWEPFATVVMTNHSMTLLRVNQSLTS